MRRFADVASAMLAGGLIGGTIALITFAAAMPIKVSPSSCFFAQRVSARAANIIVHRLEDQHL